jgi:streptogramin lyase
MVAGVAVALVALAPGPTQKAEAAFGSLNPAYQQADVLTGFPTAGGLGFGPTGIAFDSNGDVLVADEADGNLYRFPSSGGVAANGVQIGGEPFGLAFGHDGKLYVTRFGAGDLAQIDPLTGAIQRVVTSGLGSPLGLATDPISGDLFVSLCGNGVVRINPATGVRTPYTSPGALSCPDGLLFDPSGTLYVSDNGTFNIMKVDRNGASSVVTTLAGDPDGIALGRSGTSISGSLFVNRNDGVLTRIDITQSPPVVTDVASGGSRGDFVAVSPDGYLLVTQTDRVIRISPPDFQAANTCTGGASLVGCWKFDENSGAVALDSSGQGNNGTLVNAPSWTTGRSASALQFSGSSYVNVVDSPTLSIGSGDFTLAAWINRSGVPPPSCCSATIISKTTLGTAPGYWLGLLHANDGHVVFQLIRPDGGVLTGTSTTTVAAGTWHHVAVTFQRTGNATFFIDGVSAGTVNISAYSGDISNSRPLRIGRSETYDNQFDGGIDEAKIWNRALSAGEIATEAGIAPPASVGGIAEAIEQGTLATATSPASEGDRMVYRLAVVASVLASVVGPAALWRQRRVR